jgi:hypothetical protein
MCKRSCRTPELTLFVHVPIARLNRQHLLLRWLLVYLFQFFFHHHLFLVLAELGKEQYKLKLQASRRGSRGMDSVTVELGGDIHRLEP